MSKTKYPPNTGLVGHEIRRVFGLSRGSKTSLDPVEVPAQSPIEMPKGGSAGGASRFFRGPKMGPGEGMGRTRIKADDSVEVSKKIELQQSRSHNLEKVDVPERMELQPSRSQKLEKVDVPKRMELQTSRSQKLEKVDVPKRMELQTSMSQKGTKSRGPKSGCGAATGLHRVGETCAPLGGTGWLAGSGDSVAKEWRNRVLRSLSPFALPSVACPLSLPSRLFSLSPASVSVFSLSLVSDHT
ncbi:unnamed protein product [Sphagnum troendelagicum]|uniref:Uncharacterized protein n=1 Tax=Sphagnum troendelagicum TaxID=128251 RepID=A0ABP0TZM3_9BRYO